MSEVRGAAGTPSSLQGKTVHAEGTERYTAPSLLFEADGTRLEAAGHQPLAAYDVLVANLDPALRREPIPEGPFGVLELSPRPHDPRGRPLPGGSLRGAGRPPHDRVLLDLVAEGRLTREPLGGDALWRA